VPASTASSTDEQLLGRKLVCSSTVTWSPTLNVTSTRPGARDHRIAELLNRRGARFGRITNRKAPPRDSARFGQPWARSTCGCPMPSSPSHHQQRRVDARRGPHPLLYRSGQHPRLPLSLPDLRAAGEAPATYAIVRIPVQFLDELDSLGAGLGPAEVRALLHAAQQERKAAAPHRDLVGIPRDKRVSMRPDRARRGTTPALCSTHTTSFNTKRVKGRIFCVGDR
jgi:hypothetical protein